MTSRIVKTVTSLLLPFIVLFAIYIIFYGHISPGGGFQGGVILAMAVIVTILNYEKFITKLNISYLAAIEIIGVSVFIIIGLLAILMGKTFFTNLGVLPLLNVVIAIKVFAAIVLLYVFLMRWEIVND
jgi:multicomponent Na+:H+ antiporter subunit B